MTKQTNGKLGSAFWTNFVRLDRVADGKHSESKLKEALGAVSYTHLTLPTRDDV